MGRKQNTVEKFWTHVNKDGPVQPGMRSKCWLWTMSVDRCGYGKWKMNFVSYLSHRFAWTDTNGPIPAGMQCNHLCNEPACCRPSHIQLGSQKMNQAHMVKSNRQSKGVAAASAILNPKKIRKIRCEYKGRGKGPTHQELGDKYGVDKSTIYMVVKRKTWKHIK